MPLLVELLREVTGIANDLSLKRIGVKGELNAMLGIKVDEWICCAIFILKSILSSDLGNHSYAPIWQFNVLFVQLEVILKSRLNVFILQDLTVDDVAEIV